MKANRILSFGLFLIFLLSVVGCDKVPDNGRLDGMWQLMAVERDGVVTDTKAQKRYWSIRYNLLQLNGVGVQDHYAHFEREGDMLRLFDFCYFSNNATEADDNEWIPYEEREVLLQWGLEPVRDDSRPGRITQTFRINVLDASSMVLSSADYTLRFRRF
ncbi:MAG: lipocalin-like domain-containing protein [Prevotella sp.]